MITKGSSIPMNIFHFINLTDSLIYIKQKQQSYVRNTDSRGHAIVPLSHGACIPLTHILNTAFIHRLVRPPSTFKSTLSDFLFFSFFNYFNYTLAYRSAISKVFNHDTPSSRQCASQS